jgi:hypothetical protein
VPEDETTPEKLAAEESARMEAAMRGAREQGGYYDSPEVARTSEIEIAVKDRVVHVAPDTYIDIGRGTEIVKQGEIMEASDPRAKALPGRVKPFEEVFGPGAAA